MIIEKAEQIDGWMSSEELKLLAQFARKSELIVEVGAYKGRSTRVLADNTFGIVYAIDPWTGFYHKDDGSVLFYVSDVIFETFYNNLKEYIDSKKVIPIQGTLDDFNIQNIDFIFIDGDHRYDYVKRDIIKALSLLGPDGIIAGHDYIYSDWPGVKQAVDEIFGKNIRIKESIWWTQK